MYALTCIQHEKAILFSAVAVVGSQTPYYRRGRGKAVPGGGEVAPRYVVKKGPDQNMQKTIIRRMISFILLFFLILFMNENVNM